MLRPVVKLCLVIPIGLQGVCQKTAIIFAHGSDVKDLDTFFRDLCLEFIYTQCLLLLTGHMLYGHQKQQRKNG
jgi:hypothetical protein